ncbi:arsenite efflux transporter metallochaperone ArsD [Lacrimispora defluvii]|uniref:Arsenite efflux transporter metallochaperone ArsD n=1 Tax=Lacrimispora defluvii TaxID=2719233 RepID=A0ABX1VQB3_9FIRM|nr:arsenite efflux transporter metallochaperone ArsD [Lacrimispora defluvii]NNJ29481.1 arsenite efflux transporter metallochaperone ArsD [Lacrimispora defluvii]
MKKMQIFEPAMCCSTGLCGVSVDPELLRISTVLNTLKNHGVHVGRFNLTNAPREFVSNKTVNDFVREKGADGLPVIIVDGKIAITGRYPSNEEFIKLLDVPGHFIGKIAGDAESEKSKGCGCSGGDCCC